MTAPRRATAITLALVLVGAACGDEATEPGDPTAYCAELSRSVEENVTAFDAQDPTDPEAALASLDTLRDLADPEVRDDLDVLRDAFAELADALAEIDPDDPDAAAQVAGIELDEEAIARAQDAVTTYTRETCNLNLDAVRPPSPTTTAPGGSGAPTTVAPTTLPPDTVTPESLPPA